jgi:hypothetical protein
VEEEEGVWKRKLSGIFIVGKENTTNNKAFIK